MAIQPRRPACRLVPQPALDFEHAGAIAAARRARSAQASPITALHALFGADPRAPADAMLAIVRTAAKALPKPRQRALQALIMGHTAQEAGKVHLRSLALFPELAIAFQGFEDALAAALDATIGLATGADRDATRAATGKSSRRGGRQRREPSTA